MNLFTQARKKKKRTSNLVPTTFFGLVPMAIGLNINFLDFEINFGSPSSQWWLQLSNAIVFGVMFSFILTLIITPCLILIGEKSKIFKTF